MGKVIMSGIVPPLVAPSSGILASDLAVGSSVYLMENGVATEYLVVNQGLPSASTQYDSSCDGMWILRKYLCDEERYWDSSNSDYANSDIHSYLNNEFLNLFDSVAKSAIKQVKIPYRVGSSGSTISSGPSGLSTKVFLLSLKEVGCSTNIVQTTEGAKLDYFDEVGTGSDTKRVAYRVGAADDWALRSTSTSSTNGVAIIERYGSVIVGAYANQSMAYRPALVLPSNALFDENTLILKGVK